MVSILLNTIHATRCGNWDLYLECVRIIVTYAFAYDHLNYAKYSTPMLGELLNLRIEAHKVIETAINKDSKCIGGWKGFSTKADTVS